MKDMLESLSHINTLMSATAGVAIAYDQNEGAHVIVHGWRPVNLNLIKKYSQVYQQAHTKLASLSAMHTEVSGWDKGADRTTMLTTIEDNRLLLTTALQSARKKLEEFAIRHFPKMLNDYVLQLQTYVSDVLQKPEDYAFLSDKHDRGAGRFVITGDTDTTLIYTYVMHVVDLRDKNGFTQTCAFVLSMTITLDGLAFFRINMIPASEKVRSDNLGGTFSTVRQMQELVDLELASNDITTSINRQVIPVSSEHLNVNVAQVSSKIKSIEVPSTLDRIVVHMDIDAEDAEVEKVVASVTTLMSQTLGFKRMSELVLQHRIRTDINGQILEFMLIPMSSNPNFNAQRFEQMVKVFGLDSGDRRDLRQMILNHLTRKR